MAVCYTFLTLPKIEILSLLSPVRLYKLLLNFTSFDLETCSGIPPKFQLQKSRSRYLDSGGALVIHTTTENITSQTLN